MKKFLKVTCLVFLSMSLFMSCAKKDILPEEDITVKESSENYEKGTDSDRRVKLYYDDYGIRYYAANALEDALDVFNSTFNKDFYMVSKSYWSHYAGFDDIYDAWEHLDDNYEYDSYFAVAGASNRINNDNPHGNLGIVTNDHLVIDWKRLQSNYKRKSCFLHEFSHCVPGMGNVRGNGDDCSSSLCVMTAKGVNCGSLTFCSNCKAIINGWSGN